MKQEIKQQIAEAAAKYLKDTELTAAELATKANINEAYISVMLRGIFTTNVGGKDVDIADRWFLKLALVIGLVLEDISIGTIFTEQFIEIIPLLNDAKKYGLVYTIIGESGCGKTFSVDKFCIQQPKHTYRITVSSLHNLKAIIDELMGTMGLNPKGRDVAKLRKIAEFLEKLKLSGGKPVIIIDEAENMKSHALRMLKALYDAVIDYCGIVLVGTPELIEKLEKMKLQGKDGMPQLYRRLRAGIRTIKRIDGNYDKFFEQHVEDKALRSLLSEKCDNYGELNDYLLPVIREANRRQLPLTEELFRIYHNLPPTKAA